MEVEQPASHEGARWRAGEQGIRSHMGDKVGSHLVHLTDVPNTFTPTAAGVCRQGYCPHGWQVTIRVRQPASHVGE